MPTETGVRLAEDLTNFRVETERRFGSLEKDIAGFRSSVETELGLIRKLGDRLLGALIAGVGAVIVWAAIAGWYGSAFNSEVRQQGARAEKLEGRVDWVVTRLDGIDAKLDALLSRVTPKPGA